MSAQMQEALDMNAENQETPKSEDMQAVQDSQSAATESSDSSEAVSSELGLSQWSIVTFEGVAVSGLYYEEALKWLERLDKQKISGLCIVTDEAAARISK
jgi:hypothetical protein